MIETKSHFSAAHLGKNAANFVPLSPLSFLKRAAVVHPNKISVIHDGRRFTYGQFYERCTRLASALSRRGVGAGDTVAIMAPNIPAMLEAHYGVAAVSAVVNPLNFRIEPETIAFILQHGEAKVFIADREFSHVIKPALEKLAKRPFIIEIDDPLAAGGEQIGDCDYETLLSEGDPDFCWRLPPDEWEAFALSYTSGTTGDPKGVVYHHRGAYINSLANIAAWHMPAHPVYLWTLPIFHSLGWCFPWTISILAGTHVCLRKVNAQAIFNAIAAHGVTHMCCAPVVLNMLINARDEERSQFDHTVEIMTAASPPPATVIKKIESYGFRITHVYGLTEVYGPAFVCEWQNDWNDLSRDQQASMKARQGVAYPTIEEIQVADSITLVPVPKDGATMGEVLVRGNTIMSGYLKNSKATADAFAGGWFHTGDLTVRYPDGYVELKDRCKDIIISGGENISTIEVESVLYQHPAVQEAAVVARPDEKWGETPCAFVTLNENHQVTEQEIISFCREHLAGFKVPKTVVFGPLAKTSTGKIQKFVLRKRAASL